MTIFDRVLAKPEEYVLDVDTLGECTVDSPVRNRHFVEECARCALTPSPAASATRCTVAGVVGRTNAGKSSLVNALVREKVSIVSPVVQTTRNTIRGILTEKRGQIVLVDTPGLHRSAGRLGTLMNRMARQAAAGVDVLLLVFDGSVPPHIEDDGWMRRVLFAEQPTLFALNKSDAGPLREAEFRARWELVQSEKERRRDVPWLRVSAHTRAGLPDLVDALFSLAAPGPLLFDADTVTDYPRRLAIADAIREKLYRHLREELPHEVGVRVDDIEEEGRVWRVRATVFVSRPSQKPIVIGPRGRVLRAVTRAVEPEIGAMFDVQATVTLWVKVERDWTRNFWLLRQMGCLGER
jgi:GTP-binding protein Era